MGALSTATARNKQHDVFRRADSGLAFPEMPLDSSVTPSKPKQQKASIGTNIMIMLMSVMNGIMGFWRKNRCLIMKMC